MFKRISHAEGMKEEGELLFFTNFDYLFPEAARSRPCLLPDSEQCTAGLMQLGTAMATSTVADPEDSPIPAVYTYFGQFIDHDTTARTDREGAITSIGNYAPVGGIDPDHVVASLKNGRRPDFDLDSVFGEAPALAGRNGTNRARSVSQTLYNDDLTLKLFTDGGRRDVPRGDDRRAILPDARNDENINLSQLQYAMMAFYNVVHAAQAGSDAEKMARARQLCRWAFQFVVVNDWLRTVCDGNVVHDMIANGPRFFAASAGRGASFMPLEFSVAGFRFAHSLIRPSYRMNAGSPLVNIEAMLDFASKDKAANDQYFDAASSGVPQLKQDFVIDWNFFVRDGTNVQFARLIDTKLSQGLGHLPFAGREGDPALGHLARSNLLRGKNLSIPTGQAMADAFGVDFLTPKEIYDGESADIQAVHDEYGFHHRSPLWYYVLREAAVQQRGRRLGEVGSRIVAETVLGFIKRDFNSYFYPSAGETAIRPDGIDVLPGAGGKVNSIRDIVTVAGLL